MYSKIEVTLSGIPLKTCDCVANGEPALNERT